MIITTEQTIKQFEDLNQVQNALEEKAKDEIKKIVTNFMRDINAMEQKYNAYSDFNMGGNNNSLGLYNINSFEKVITQTLIDRHLEYIVEYKSKELLKKIELL